MSPNPPTDGLVGSNYTPAYAVNQVQFWHDFRADVVTKELAAAKRFFGISTLRVYLHNINFDEDRENFMANIEAFLEICDKHGIRPGFVFFDGCHRHEGIFLDRPTEPVSGYHNGRWAQCPQARDIDKDDIEKFKPYTQEIIRPYRADKRIMFWEIHNEPPPGDEYRDRLKRAGYEWAKELEPIQPILNCEKGKRGWADCEVTDIVDAHVYSHAHGPLRDLSDFNREKGTVFTEAGARWRASRRNFGGPIDMVFWLTQRRKQGKSTPGMYLCWELMVGNSNCRWHWIDKPGAPEPEIPWCGLLWPDCTPVSLAEVEAVRRYATGKSTALFFEDFETHSARAWKPYGGKELPTRNAVTLAPGMKAVAGEASWADYVLEGRVVIRPSKDVEGAVGAGLLFRVNDPGEGLDEMRGYAVTHDGKYHFFWQCNPAGRKWANMYWGHATSPDMVHWTEHDRALRSFGGNVENRHRKMAVKNCFSGSGNVDHNNTAGWQTGDEKTLVLAFTDTGCGEALAYSNDRGKTWKYYEGNPVIRHRGRDPKLMWYEPGQHWVIAVFDECKEFGRNIAIYTSKDLKEWERVSNIPGYFECAEIFELPVKMKDGRVTFRVLVDRPICEVIGGGGACFKTSGRRDAGQPLGSISLTAEGGSLTVETFKAYEMKSIWK